jgi:hypothetical protein
MTLPCSINSTSQLLFASELSSDLSFVPFGFISTSPLAAMSCTNAGTAYFFLGPFVANNYIFKTFSGIGTNHFQIDVLWSYGIFGPWGG